MDIPSGWRRPTVARSGVEGRVASEYGPTTPELYIGVVGGDENKECLNKKTGTDVHDCGSLGTGVS